MRVPLLRTLLGAALLSPPLAADVVVESVAKGSAAERAGVRPGDALVLWSRPGAGGRFGCPVDVDEVRVEEAPRAPVSLRLKREGKALAVRLAVSDWGIALRPVSPGADACAVNGPRAEAHLLQDQGAARRSADDARGAEPLFRQALALREKAAPGSLALAQSLHALGEALRSQGKLAEAVPLLERARKLRAALAPESPELALTIHQLAIVAWLKSDLARAERLDRQALSVVRKRAAGSVAEGDILNLLGLAARDRGDGERAEKLISRSSELKKAAGPRSVPYAQSLVNLAAIASDRGDIDRSTELLREALDVFESASPGGLLVAHVENNLGVSARDRGELALAEEHFRRSLALREKAAPESLETATSLSNLGGVLNLEGRREEALQALHRSLALREKLAPGGNEHGRALSALGTVARDAGDLAGARAFFEKALAVREKVQPRSIDAAEALSELGDVERRLGDFPRAEELLTRALEIRARIAPGTFFEAESAHALGLLARDRGETGKARAFFARALDALEAQSGRLGARDEALTGFAAAYETFYQDQIALLHDAGRDAEAFAVLERSRARALRALLSRRDLKTPGLGPDLFARQRKADAEEERARAALESAKTRAAEEAALAALRRVGEERESIATAAAGASPRLAALGRAAPLGLAGARRALDPDTAFLAFAVLPERTLLFAVTLGGRGEGVAVFGLPVARKTLEDEVALFRSLLVSEKEGDALAAQARRLFDLLLAPAAAAIAPYPRLLVSAGGPLLTLPFAALQPAPGRFLVEEKALAFTSSATVWAQLAAARGRSRRGSLELVAFGDPACAPPSGEAAEGSSAPARYRRGLPPLPEARREVEAIRKLFGARAQAFVGTGATEERAAALGEGPRFVHFACHALLDRRAPLESGLALARPRDGSRENGLLQAWEIFERMRLDADLVTLSGCETGIGPEAAGEGLLGLTRAFQLAGARSVLASLWSVSDRSTSRLMLRFYEEVRKGAPRDEALRRAQLDMLRSDFRAPYHWAAFALFGDAR